MDCLDVRRLSIRKSRRASSSDYLASALIDATHSGMGRPLAEGSYSALGIGLDKFKPFRKLYSKFIIFNCFYISFGIMLVRIISAKYFSVKIFIDAAVYEIITSLASVSI